jgi:pyruvate/2-oxoglutarate dehydrogenase complex dihydrolipoamide dehydrogenase (E3) component
METSMDKSLIVIGAGPAGIEASLTAARCGARVTLIHEGPLGGRSTHGSLLPSKVWLAAARPGATPAKILERLGKVKSAWVATQQRLLTGAGVECVQGRARITGAGVVEIDGQSDSLQADAVILASGSEPTFPPALKPDGKRVIAPRLLAKLDWLPPRVVVIGGGPTGCEAVHLFNALGAAVTWLPGRPGTLAGFARPAVQILCASFAQRGVEILADADAVDIERGEDQACVVTDTDSRIEAELVFVATGRRADLDGQGLDSLGLDLPPATDTFGYAAQNLYLVGDAAGGPFLANRALAQARIATRHALDLPCAGYTAEAVVHAVYSQPEVAQVGCVEGDGIRSLELPLDTALKAYLRSPDGRFSLSWDAEQRITGGWIVGVHAADALAPVAAAIAAQATLEQLAASWPANPTLGELAPMVARLAVDAG